MGLAETSGYYTNLKKGFLDVGQECVFISLDENKHQYWGDDTPIFFVRAYKYFYRLKNWYSHYYSLNFIITNIMRILKLLIFIWAIIKFDVFIFTGGSSFYRYYDYPILKFFNRMIVKVHLGSGSRPPFLDGAIVHGAFLDSKPSLDRIIELTEIRKKELLWMDRYIDILIDHPPQAYFHERDFISLLYVGIPFNTDKFAGMKSGKNSVEIDDRVKILHAPSFASHKGTDEIRAIIKELVEEGYDIKYTEVTNVPNKVVLDEIQKCDFVIDELYSDTPMATLAAEAAFFGKPAVVGGYYFNQLSYYYKNLLIPPTVHCHPSQMKNAIIKLINDKSYRKKIGTAAQNFVLNIWSPRVVAMKYMQIINGKVPQYWMFSPYKINYLNGGGINENCLKKLLRDMIEKEGIESLQLRDKQDLEKKFYDFAYNHENQT